MSRYWWWIVTFDMYEYPVEVQVTVAAVTETDAAIEAENMLHEMGVRGAYTWSAEQQDRVERES